VSVAADRTLEDLRVVWAFQGDAPLETILGRLAELTDSRVTEHTSEEGKRRLTLERKLETARREAAWKTEALRGTIRELLRAAEESEHGQLRPDTFSKNVQSYLELGRAPQLKYLRLLTPEQMSRLLQGEPVLFAPGAVPDAEIQQIIKERYSGQGREDERAEDLARYQENELQRVRQYGLGLQIDFNRKGHLFYLVLQIGDRGANALSGFGAEELGLPLTRTNPYRVLESDAKSAPIGEVPPHLRRPLAADVSLPAGDARWETALRKLAEIARLDVMSDGYLCRAASRQFARPGAAVLVARRGVMLGEALDLVCRQYGYLWWEKDGCCYFRTRSWPWDDEYEVPDQFLDLWKAALARGTVSPREISAVASLTPMQLNGLGDLGGGQFLNRANLDNDDVRQFLKLFRSCSPAQQMQLMGQGLLVAPEQTPGYDPLSLSKPQEAVSRPVLLRLMQSVSTDASAALPARKATMRVLRPLEPQVWQPEFSLQIPEGAGELNPPEPESPSSAR
jgi:hypothetical protein